jgi:hypothetical protein
LTGASAAALKTRIIISGDLLKRGDDASLAAPVAVNLRKALYVFDDYMSYHDDSGDHEALGEIVHMPDLQCQTGERILGANVLSYKSNQGHAFVFFGPTNSPSSICRASKQDNSAAIAINIYSQVKPVGYSKEPKKAQPDQIKLSNVYELIRQGPPRQAAN